MGGNVKWDSALGQSWRDHVQGLEATFAPVNDALLSALDAQSPVRIADIGCGGGGLTRHLSKTLGKSTEITGFDISPDLVAAAKDQSSSLPVDFVCANAQTHRITPPEFDGLTSGFGVMFFEDELVAFRNLRSWLKEEGRFAFAVWADYSDNPWQGLIRDVAGDFVDVPDVTAGEPSAVRYAEVETFIAILEQAGFSDISVTDWRDTLKLGGGLPARDAADFGLSAFWGEELPPSSPVRAKAVDRLTSVFEPYEIAGEVTMAARVHIVTGEAKG